MLADNGVAIDDGRQKCMAGQYVRGTPVTRRHCEEIYDRPATTPAKRDKRLVLS
jgi:hypothetical protein